MSISKTVVPARQAPVRYAIVRPLFRIATLLILAAAPLFAIALPTMDQVPPGKALPIDGEWEMTFYGTHVTFHIEKGRAYATTAYTVALLNPVKVGEVTCTSLRSKAAGRYVGYDLVMSGKWLGTLQADGTLKIRIRGALANVNVDAKALKLDNPAWFQKELAAAGKGEDRPPTAAPAAGKD